MRCWAERTTAAAFGICLLLASVRRHSGRSLQTLLAQSGKRITSGLILVIVVLFTAFPPAFAAISTALNIPLTLLLIGIVLRGTTFTFRAHDAQHDEVQRRWSLLFSIASIITPLLLGIVLGAIASGTIRVENGVVVSGFLKSWLAPFPFSVGFFALSLFAFLAAVLFNG